MASVRAIRQCRPELFQQRPRLDQVGEGESLGECGVDGGQQPARTGHAPLVAAQPGEIARGVELDQGRRLRPGDLRGAPELPLRAGRVAGASRLVDARPSLAFPFVSKMHYRAARPGGRAKAISRIKIGDNRR